MHGDETGKIRDHIPIVLLVEEIDEVGADRRTDPGDRRKILIGSAFRILRRHHRLAPGLEGQIVAGEQLRRLLADLWNAECKDEAFERDLTSRLDRTQQIVDREFAPAFALQQQIALVFQPEEIGWRSDEAIGEERLDMLAAEPVDIERHARHEVSGKR